MKKLLSRKLWIAVGSLVTVVSAAVSGQVPWPEALPTIGAIVVGYCIAQGWIDGKEVEKLAQPEAEALPASETAPE